MGEVLAQVEIGRAKTLKSTRSSSEQSFVCSLGKMSIRQSFASSSCSSSGSQRTLTAQSILSSLEITLYPFSCQEDRHTIGMHWSGRGNYSWPLLVPWFGPSASSCCGAVSEFRACSSQMEAMLKTEVFPSMA